MWHIEHSSNCVHCFPIFSMVCDIKKFLKVDMKFNLKFAATWRRILHYSQVQTDLANAVVETVYNGETSHISTKVQGWWGSILLQSSSPICLVSLSSTFIFMISSSYSFFPILSHFLSVCVCMCVHIVWECMSVGMCMPREVHRCQRTLCMVLTFHVVWDTVFCCFLWPCGSPYLIVLQGCWDYSPCLALVWVNLNKGSHTFLTNFSYTELSPKSTFTL